MSLVLGFIVTTQQVTMRCLPSLTLAFVPGSATIVALENNEWTTQIEIANVFK